MATLTHSSRARKGRNFTTEEEMQLCCCQLCISQDSIVGNGQRREAFWERVCTHFNQHRPRGLGARTARSIETKFGVIKHDVSKFYGAHGFCVNNKESGQSLDDVLQAALDLYKVQHPKHQSFVFLHCWLILKEHPRWMETPGERSQRGPLVQLNDEQQHVPSDCEEGDGEMPAGGDEEAPEPIPVPPEPLRSATPLKRARPIGNKCAKEEERQRIHREHVARAQGRVSAEMAQANRAKARVLEDQSALHIFTMPVSESLSEEAREYLALRREEELINIRVRVGERKAALALQEAARKRAEAAAAREVAAREEEMQAAVARCNPPAAPPRGVARHDAPAPRREPMGPATTPTPTGAGTASTAAASASPFAVREQGDDNVPDEESPRDFAPELSHRPLGYGDGRSNPNVHPTQESVVSETQPDYLSTPTTARLLSSITSRHPAGLFYFPAHFDSLMLDSLLISLPYSPS
jgi:hypothetical protein